MAQTRKTRHSGNRAEIKGFVGKITREERLLVILKRELYDGSWQDMREDLRNRLDGRPYIFKLVNRITDDIERIGNLEHFEQEYGVDLADFIRPGDPPIAEDE